MTADVLLIPLSELHNAAVVEMERLEGKFDQYEMYFNSSQERGVYVVNFNVPLRFSIEDWRLEGRRRSRDSIIAVAAALVSQ